MYVANRTRVGLWVDSDGSRILPKISTFEIFGLKFLRLKFLQKTAMYVAIARGAHPRKDFFISPALFKSEFFYVLLQGFLVVPDIDHDH
jgi:hypothetical protein